MVVPGTEESVISKGILYSLLIDCFPWCGTRPRYNYGASTHRLRQPSHTAVYASRNIGNGHGFVTSARHLFKKILQGRVNCRWRVFNVNNVTYIVKIKIFGFCCAVCFQAYEKAVEKLNATRNSANDRVEELQDNTKAYADLVNTRHC